MEDVFELNKLCRTCLKETEDKYEIFDVVIKTDEAAYSLNDMFLAFTSTPLHPEDNLPKFICRVCLERLHNAFTFKKQCEQSYDDLMKVLKLAAKQDCSQFITFVTGHNEQESVLKGNSSVIAMTNTICENDNKSTNIELYRCTKCENRFSTAELLKKHNLTHKNSSQALLCAVCGKTIKSCRAFKLHMDRHTGVKKIECTTCGKRFYDKQRLTVHGRTHTGEKPYICQVCGKTFAQYGVLKIHLTLHTERPVSCGICGQGFSRKSQLTVHLRRHTGEQPFTCGKCGKGFIMKSHLKEHILLHTQQRPHACKKCGCSFQKVCTLKAHEKTHLPKYPYVCQVCNLSYMRQDQYSQHLELHKKSQQQSV